MDEQTCCPEFTPEPWDGKTFEWKDKRFIKDRVFTLFYMPMNFGAVMRRLDAKVRGGGGTMPEGLCLSDHTSKWNMDVYLAVDREIAGAENVALSGRFFSKVYEGPYKDTGKWCQDFKERVGAMKLDIAKWYMWYTTCPKCAKKRGKNCVVVVGQTR